MNRELEQYIEREIIPRYAHFDAAHRTDPTGSVFVGKEKRRKEQVSSSQIFDSLFRMCFEQ